MRIIYVTAQLPYGESEAFIIPEIAELERQRCEVTIVPVRPAKSLPHGDARALLERSIPVALLAPCIIGAAALELITAPRTTLAALVCLRRSRTFTIFLKNLSVYPKGLWLGRRARTVGAVHIHAHWGGTTATVALIASRVSDVPWSVTLHRWDIVEDNLLEVKARDASFVRVISEQGARTVAEHIGLGGWQPWLLHMGVHLPVSREEDSLPEPPLRAVVPAALLEVKGHIYLIEAADRLKRAGLAVQIDLAGDGPQRGALELCAAERGLGSELTFLGTFPHERLLEQLAARRWHVLLLPSVVAQDGAHEGIPVALMEAMACGVPVLSTESGAIPELIGEGAGLVVPPADPDALADAIASLVGDPRRRSELGARGRRRIEQGFEIEDVVTALRRRFEEHARSAVAGG